jgi:formate hydrogenlyase subunit 3/multisubunit Na+/H+ antiporter MnhD subunit
VSAWDRWLPLVVLASSLLPGIVIFLLPEESRRARTLLNLTGALGKMAAVGWMLLVVAAGREPEIRLPLLPGGPDLVLRADAPSLLFVTLSSLLWLVTTVYAVGYLEDSPNRSRFFGFFSLCVTASVGVALAGNLVTLLVFYELLTVSTYPLVVHRGTPKSMRAGRIYLLYTILGGAVLLLGIAWLQTLAGAQDFVPGGYLRDLSGADPLTLQLIFLLLALGFGVKAALVPVHGWLPQAMAAPAPVSALLHAVAVVKAGAFGLVRVIYDVYGVTFASSLGVLLPLAITAAVTILYGSLQALRQDELKKRLAFSTVSQMALIVLGLALAGPLAAIGGLVHLVHHAFMKITLFFCVGNYAETLGIHHVRELDGVGRRMPWTTAALAVGALGMVGVPPVAGFVSKWYLAAGADGVGAWWVVAVLATSSALNAAYYLPLLYRAWFRPAPAAWPQESPDAPRRDAKRTLLVPALITAAVALLVGLGAGHRWSPLSWTRAVVASEYGE